MADSFYGMAAKQVGFPRPVGSRPWGMPETDDDDFMGEALRYADEMKNRDMMRAKEMMAYRQQQELQARAPQVMAAKIEAARQLNPANKKYVLGAGSGTGKLPPSTVEASNAARDKQAADMNREFAAIQAKREELAAGRASAEKIAQMGADYKNQIAQNKGWSIANVQDPANPTKTKTFRVNQATGEVEPLDYEGQNLGGVAKPGTKLPVQGMAPEALQGIRDRTTETIQMIDDLQDKATGQLKPHALDATGKSRIIPGWADKLGMGSFFPETTRGSTGINNLKSKLVIDLIGEMKAQSKTGATGFGAMNRDELRILETAANRLNPDDEEGFAKELKVIRAKLEKILNKSEEETNQGNATATPGARPSVFGNQQQGRGQTIRRTPGSNTYTNKLDPDALIQKYSYGTK
jgi:hypothetical protein